jgi:hypothetical protein
MALAYNIDGKLSYFENGYSTEVPELDYVFYGLHCSYYIEDNKLYKQESDHIIVCETDMDSKKVAIVNSELFVISDDKIKNLSWGTEFPISGVTHILREDINWMHFMKGNDLHWYYLGDEKVLLSDIKAAWCYGGVKYVTKDNVVRNYSLNDKIIKSKIIDDHIVVNYHNTCTIVCPNGKVTHTYPFKFYVESISSNELTVMINGDRLIPIDADGISPTIKFEGTLDKPIQLKSARSVL